jgi:hypothetical protein
MPTGDCGTCLENTEATLFGDPCTAGDGACTACTTQTNACKAN